MVEEKIKLTWAQKGWILSLHMPVWARSWLPVLCLVAPCAWVTMVVKNEKHTWGSRHRCVLSSSCPCCSDCHHHCHHSGGHWCWCWWWCWWQNEPESTEIFPSHVCQKLMCCITICWVNCIYYIQCWTLEYVTALTSSTFCIHYLLVFTFRSIYLSRNHPGHKCWKTHHR